MDHPLVRHQTICPLCIGYKQLGLVACWTCYRAFDLRNGNQAAEAIIDAAEALQLALASGGLAHVVPA